MVDLMFVARNRFEFSKMALETMARNTNFKLAKSVTVYDDMSVDGSSDWFMEFCKKWTFSYVRKPFNSVVKVMREAIQAGRARYLVKLDNDVMVPHGWLDVCVDQLERNAHIDLLGIEAMHAIEPNMAAIRRCDPALHIGGIGLFRMDAFERGGLPQVQANQFNGFTEWQGWNRHHVTPAWLVPSIPVCLLDHVPFEPWRGLKAQYIDKGWQRYGWGEYPAEKSALWEWWAPGAHVCA